MTGGLHMTRRGWSALGLVACTAAMMAGAPAASAASGSGCQLAANVTFVKKMALLGADMTWKLTGNLSGCQGNATPAPSGASIEIGQTYTDPATSKQYIEPLGTGNPACLGHNLAPWKGLAIVKWAGGGLSLLNISLTGAGPGALQLSSNAPLASTTLSPVNSNDDPLVVQSTAYKTYSFNGVAAINAPFADCATGLGSASLSGVFGPYSTS